jgi:hypothetical protein
VSCRKSIFVNYPRWSAGLTAVVGEILSDGRITPDPSESWYSWNDTTTHYGRKVVCVQSVFVDDEPVSGRSTQGEQRMMDDIVNIEDSAMEEERIRSSTTNPGTSAQSLLCTETQLS